MEETTTQLLIGPALLKKIEGLRLISRRLYQGGQSGVRKSRTRGSGMEFADHREYSPGDDFRTIDWNVYARLDELIVKTFETEQNLHVSVIIDTSASMGFGSPSKLLFAASLGAALGYLCLVNEDGLTLAGVSDQVHTELSTARETLSPSRVFQFCQDLQPAGMTHLDQTLRAFAFHSRRPGLLFIVSDFLFPGKLEDVLQPLVYAGYDICGIHICSQEELSPNLAGEMDIVDSETGETLPLTVRQNTRQDYRSALDRFLRRAEQALKTCQANYLRVTNDLPLDRIIMHELRSVGLLTE